MTKQEHYQHLVPQAHALCEGENDLIAKMANLAALLHSEFQFWWTGFYRVVPKATATDSNSPAQELILGPFQGPLACMHIAYGRGVCGTAWKERRTIVVPDVEQFPGHIACSSESRSEIVVPIFARTDNGAPSAEGQEVIAVLDIDSRHLATFDETDRQYLEQIVQAL